MRHVFEITGIALLAMVLVASAPAGNRAFADETEAAAAGPTDLSLDEGQRAEYVARMELTPEQIEGVQPILDSADKARRDALAHYGVNFETNTRPGLIELIKLKFAIDDINNKAEELLDPHLSDAQMGVYRDIVGEREAVMRERLMAMN